MKTMAENKPTHVVKANVFDVLGFSASEASALKIKAELLSAILEHVKATGYTQAQLAGVLDEYQPSVSNLHRKAVALCRLAASPYKHRHPSHRRPKPPHNESTKANSATPTAKISSGGLAPHALLELGSIRTETDYGLRHVLLRFAQTSFNRPENV